MSSNSEYKRAVITTAPATAMWNVDDEGNIYFKLTSNGFTREQWGRHFKSRRLHLSERAKRALCSASEAPTNGVTYNIVVLPGWTISDGDRITKKIREAAKAKGWVKPHWEVGCLIRDMFTNKQLSKMGLWYILTMHEPIKVPRDSCLLRTTRRSSTHVNGDDLAAGFGRPGIYWSAGGGFAFVVPQISP